MGRTTYDHEYTVRLKDRELEGEDLGGRGTRIGIFPLSKSCERGAAQNMKTQQGGRGAQRRREGVTLSSSPEFNKLSFVPLLLEIRIHGRHNRQMGPLN